MPKVGAHVSAAGSLERSFEKAQEIGADCTQIFISPPQQWVQAKHGVEEILKYTDTQNESGIGPNFIHGTYLINLAASDPAHLQKSIDWLIYALDMADKLKVEGTIFHTGSHSGRGFETVLDQIVKAIIKILAKSQNSKLILENSAGQGGSVGSTFGELGQIIKQVQDDRLKVCIDTCHAYVAGYDIKNKLDGVLEEFDRKIGLKNLVAIHANDCKFDLRSNKDRHENIGKGFLGSNAFKNMLNHPKLQNIPFILEVPGFTNSGPDKENVQILKGLVNSKKDS